MITENFSERFWIEGIKLCKPNNFQIFGMQGLEGMAKVRKNRFFRKKILRFLSC